VYSKKPNSIPLDQKLVLTLDEAAIVSNVCKSALYAAITSRELPAKKRGRSTLVLTSALKAWVEALPEYSPSLPRSNRQLAARATREAAAAA
jgi:excisionase family DNA binding protein